MAPLRFGGGIKGKITDSWSNYLPVITTPIGSEGMYYESSYDECTYTDINENAMYFNEKLSPKTE